MQRDCVHRVCVYMYIPPGKRTPDERKNPFARSFDGPSLPSTVPVRRETRSLSSRNPLCIGS